MEQIVQEKSGERSKFFESIESKHGEPVQVWLDRLSDSGETSYPAQIALLRDEHGFSRTHANSVVMWFRGSTTSKRFDGLDTYFESVGMVKSATMRKIFAEIAAIRSGLNVVIAWNQPIVRTATSYVFGLSAAKAHLTVNPFSDAALTAAGQLLTGFVVNKHTFHVPVDWEVNAELVHVLVRTRLAEIDAHEIEDAT